MRSLREGEDSARKVRLNRKAPARRSALAGGREARKGSLSIPDGAGKCLDEQFGTIQLERFSDLMRVGDSLRSLRAWR